MLCFLAKMSWKVLLNQVQSFLESIYSVSCSWLSAQSALKTCNNKHISQTFQLLLVFLEAVGQHDIRQVSTNSTMDSFIRSATGKEKSHHQILFSQEIKVSYPQGTSISGCFFGALWSVNLRMHVYLKRWSTKSQTQVELVNWLALL